MPDKKPHSSLEPEIIIDQVLNVSSSQFEGWPESVKRLALELASELFIIRYNPFINPQLVQQSVFSRLDNERGGIAPKFLSSITQALEKYWHDYLEDQRFKEKVRKKISRYLSTDNVSTNPATLLECSTDATDLRLDMPMMVVFPEDTAQVQAVVRLANEMQFGLVPRGGATGLTGGAIPCSRRTVVINTGRLKKIMDIDPESMVLTAQSGGVTLDAIRAVDRKGLLFTVDPASKAASSLGGNVSENAGGPFAFEYGTTLDNVLSYKMVTPTGDLIQVKRINHPRHKILPHETVVFEIKDEQGRVKNTVRLKGDEIRTPGLGKDVTNKFLGGLPGIQKEGVDGLITEVSFTLYPQLAHYRVLCLEFFGHTMHNAMQVIQEIVALRDGIRKSGDKVKISALEEFGTKYVQAIEYQKKSSTYEGEPMSVLILQLDSDDLDALQEVVEKIVQLVSPYDQVDVFVADDDKEAEKFWEDRHRLSAITKHTSGFKINEDVVIPLEVIPEFADFIENLNLYYLALAYRKALNRVLDLPGVSIDDEYILMELQVIAQILKQQVTKDALPEQIYELQIVFFFQDLKGRYPAHRDRLDEILKNLQSSRVIIANHMHAGDGNCHVNLPVNSNDPEMMRLAEAAAARVFEEVLRLNGQVSGEHGIGLTKIKYLSSDKIEALKAYKAEVDPGNIFNPQKLVQRKMVSVPYTFSFNQLIEDLRRAGLDESDLFIDLLKSIQNCSHCGKCKQACPMFIPRKGKLYHPRNKNISLAGLIEALYYTMLVQGDPDQQVLNELRTIVEHCTACGRCTSICPVKIKAGKVSLEARNYLKARNVSGHAIKDRLLDYVSQDPVKQIPRMAKAAVLGQKFQNALVGIIPAFWRKKATSPVFQTRTPAMEYRNLSEVLNLHEQNLFVSGNNSDSRALLYFPGCGAGIFYPSIGLAGLALLLETGRNVVLPRNHMCCGYPLLAAGDEDGMRRMEKENTQALNRLIADFQWQGLNFSHILTSCGTCREGIQGYRLKGYGKVLQHQDVVQYLLENLQIPQQADSRQVLYHHSCHVEWEDINPLKAGGIYARKFREALNLQVEMSTGCCGESGLGAMSSPRVFNPVRQEKIQNLGEQLPGFGPDIPLLVGCPSCKIGIGRCMEMLKDKRPVMHTAEYTAERLLGEKWRKDLLQRIKNAEQDRNMILIKAG
ncbi:FAD-binding and (Fe-S)-binding domain-containing protein [Desulfonatronospira sp.]|uniref:FAD-binding and (Fe-S)-binding domain-containing protein n=1 Tax=Desulfonatronospira sp. TaxID=1962951 RepID=UPI0025C46640|nr:FAD-binding and (Fe-S)-binding domain-containing protein [Desulfonatronospira sp.]